MSGVDYTNPSVHKADLQRIERYAASLGGGGGSSTRSTLFFNRRTAPSLSPTFVGGSPSQILILGGTEGTDWDTQIRTTGDWLLNTGASTIEYNGATTKNFLVQISYSFQTGSSGTIGLELRKNLAGVNQLRYTSTNSHIVELVDFNFVNLSQGQTLSLGISSFQAVTFQNSSESGLSGSTTRPVQIYITEI